MMDQDNKTWTGARTPGVERRMSLEWRCSTEQVSPTQRGGFMLLRRARRMEANLYQATGMTGAILTAARSGKALSDKPALEKLWGGGGGCGTFIVHTNQWRLPRGPSQ